MSRVIRTVLLTSVLTALLAATASESAAQLPVGPHLQDLRQDGVTIIWRQPAAGAGSVTVDGVRHDSASTGVLHEVRITGLAAGASYTYSVDAGGAAETGYFTTAPSDPLAPFAFVVHGDNRSNHDSHREVIEAIDAEPGLSFMINTGDMVSDGFTEDHWRSFFDIERALIRRLPWFPTVGNHEAEDHAAPAQFVDYLAAPTDTSGSELYYSFTHGNSAFIVLDGHVNSVPRLLGLWEDFNRDQLDWLASMLDRYQTDPTIQHIFVFTHEPPYSSKDGRDGSHAMRLLNGTFADHGVDAVITGHDHYMERGESPGGVRYFIMGGGGAPLYDNESEGDPGTRPARALPWLDDAHTVHWAQKSYGYMLVRVENGQVDVEIKDEAGAVLDMVSWNTGDVTVEPDGGPGDGGPTDGGPFDAGPDGGPTDGGPSDGGTADADADRPVPVEDGGFDGGVEDSGPPADGGSPPDDPGGGGCSCRAAPASSSGAIALFLALALVAARSLRRDS